MELCEGGDLYTYLQKRKEIAESTACEIIYKILNAVQYLQIYGIIHRDLKPENILMVHTEGKYDIRVVDFGLSKILGPGELCSEPFGTIVTIFSNI
jgi:serine/threonine protein kinase